MNFDPLTAVFNLGSKLVDKLLPDPVKKAEAQLELVKLQQSGELAVLAAESQIMQGQLDINKEEAKNPSLFVSGWRPFVGWVCGLGLAMQFLVKPTIEWASVALGHPVVLPPLDMGTLITMLSGLLGLGVLRSAEKIKGVARST